MLRAVVAVIVGYAAWTLIWVGGNALAFASAGEVAARGERIADVGELVGMVVLGVVCSIAGGAACGVISRRSSTAAAVLAILFLLTGLGVQLSAWAVFPVWYHVVFLVSVPVVTFAAGTRVGSTAAPARRVA